MWSVSLLQIQNLKCLSHLQLIMTQNGRAPGTSARTMPGDCWRKWTLLVQNVQGASKSLSSMSRPTLPPDSWHRRSSVPLQHFVFICIESTEKSHYFWGGHFHGRLIVAHVLPVGPGSCFPCLWPADPWLSAAGRRRHEAREHLVLRGLCAVGWWDPFPWVFIPVSQTWWRC